MQIEQERRDKALSLDWLLLTYSDTSRLKFSKQSTRNKFSLVARNDKVKQQKFPPSPKNE